MFNNNNVLRLISLVIAICLWVYVMGEVNPETKAKISDIPVSFINVERLHDAGLAIAEDEELLINATVKGKRSDVNDVKKTGLTAYVDVENCEIGRNTVNIIVNLPDGIRLDSVSKETTKIKVEELITESKPVEIIFSEEESDKENTPWVVGYEPEEIIVSGAKSSVETIDHIKGIVDIQKVESAIKNVEAVLTPVNREGDIVPEITMSYEIAYADVQMLSSKLVAVRMETKGLEYGLEIDEIESDKTIRIVGPADVIESIETVEAELDLAGMTKSGKNEMNINLPEGVYLYSKEAASVKVVLKNK